MKIVDGELGKRASASDPIRDGRAHLDYLLNHGYCHKKEATRRGQFDTLISNMGQFYSIKVYLQNGRKLEFRDSVKKIPMKVSEVAKAFKLPMEKGDLDYKLPRHVGWEITDDERSYIARDVLIICQALNLFPTNLINSEGTLG